MLSSNRQIPVEDNEFGIFGIVNTYLVLRETKPDIISDVDGRPFQLGVLVGLIRGRGAIR